MEPKKIQTKNKFYFLGSTEGTWSDENFRIPEILKTAFPIFAKVFFSEMNAAPRDLFKSIIVLGGQGICGSNLYIFNFKFDEPLRCAQNSDQNKIYFAIQTRSEKIN